MAGIFFNRKRPLDIGKVRWFLEIEILWKGVKGMKHKILMGVATCATVIASIVATSACFWGHYQPEEPKSLREE